MSRRREYIRAATAVALTEHFTKTIRDEIIDAPSFRSEFNVTADAIVNFDGAYSFQRSVLFDAVRESLENEGQRNTVVDTEGNEWEVYALTDQKPVNVAVGQGQKRFLVPHLAMLHQNAETRLEVFRKLADGVNLRGDARRDWEALLQERRPDDDEVGLIQDDFNATPASARNAIRDNLQNSTISLDVLVPSLMRYYERLVGEYKGEAGVEEYALGTGSAVIRQNIEWNAYPGFQFALLLASQPSFTRALMDIAVEPDLLTKVLGWAGKQGDAIARTACIELGLGKLESVPSIKEPLSAVIDTFAKNLPVASVDQFKLISVLFIAVYGELSFRHVLPSKPPFWRKLAALAQATLIARQLIANGGDASKFVEWLMGIRMHAFIIQCYVDMRQEPRWFPEMAMPNQFQNELVGRAWLAARDREVLVDAHGWKQRLLLEGEESILSHFKIEQAILPGPLEGGMAAAREISATEAADIRATLADAKVKSSTFMGLSNAGMSFRLSSELADLAATALARADYQLEVDDPKVPLHATLLGLATVAAVTRSTALADALFIFVRKYRKLYTAELSAHDAFRIVLTACASREDFGEWAKSVGRCMNDLAFQEITPLEANQLHSHIVHLCHLVPELWATCGQAEAALQAIPDA